MYIISSAIILASKIYILIRELIADDAEGAASVLSELFQYSGNLIFI